jgi:hypothetical protein
MLSCLSSTNCSLLSPSLFIAEPSPHSSLSNPASIPESQASPTPKTNVLQPTVSPSPPGDDISLAAVALSTSASTPEHVSQRSFSSLSLTSSAASKLMIPPEPELHHEPRTPPLLSIDIYVEEKIARGKVDLIPDPASDFRISTSSELTTTAASAPDLSRRGYSLELTSSSTSTNGGGTKLQNGGSKIRRSISEFGSRIRRQSIPLPFKSGSGATRLGTAGRIIRQDLREESRGEDGLESGWEDVREDKV